MSSNLVQETTWMLHLIPDKIDVEINMLQETEKERKKEVRDEVIYITL